MTEPQTAEAGTPGVAPLLTIGDVAQRLGVSQTTVRRAVRAGELASVRLGRTLRVTQSAVHAYLAANTTERTNR